MKSNHTSFHGSRVIYTSKSPQTSPGFIASNEVDHFSMNFPRSGGDTLLGFGSTINWDIASIRRVQTLIIADQAPEVILAHIQLYRPLFLASTTPEEFISSLAGFLCGNQKISTLFTRIRQQEPPSLEGIKDLTERLDKLVLSNQISLQDRNFTITTITKQPTPTCLDPFSKSGIKLEYPLIQMFAYLYDPVSISKISHIPRIFIWPSRFSFLGSKANYQHVRKIYENDRVLFAITDILDTQFYAEVGRSLQKLGSSLTDFYLSNICEFHPSLLQKNIAPLKTLISSLPRDKYIWIYQTEGKSVPFRYTYKKINF